MKLTKGPGDPRLPENGGCWMVAASMYAGEGWDDHPKCVPPTLRYLCIALNDMCDDGEREKLIAPHLFAPMGRSSDSESENKRAALCADWTVRNYALGSMVDYWAQKWLSGEDRTGEGANAAWLATDVAFADGATWSATCSALASTSGDAGRAAATAATASSGQKHKEGLLQLILDCCAIGPAPEQEPDLTRMAEICPWAIK